MQEIWKTIPGFKHKYEVSNFGNVKSYSPKMKGKIMSLSKIISKKWNYSFFVTKLMVGKKQKVKMVSRLVAEAFIPNPENKPQVNHIDNDPLNNHVSNLEWVTISENKMHSVKQGRHKGAKNTILK